uniref:ZP domain-containing protein n=1 Tax=Timema douglasi TaxID=61478 RepID=A0A7R8ZAC9_TIMDO|nr:unnamed protein product [Timema douglasi]
MSVLFCSRYPVRYVIKLRSHSKVTCYSTTEKIGFTQVHPKEGRSIWAMPCDKVDKSLGHKTFYHRVVLESGNGATKQVVLVKCVIGASNHTRIHKRNVLPAGFQEPEDLQIRDSLTGIAPEPLLNVGVRQGGNLVTGELNVNPGTPLQMEIYLDKSSAPVYGLLVSYMKVSDTRAQEETIIFNGCSVDPYLFENFNTVDGDFLTAKFRAFKFPESTYVQFKGTVNVCLDKCLGVDCSNGQKGYGRRRREVNSIPADSNKVFEVTMTTFIKVDYKDDTLLQKGKLGASVILPKQNETVVAEITSDGASNNINQNLKLAATEGVSEELQYTVILQERNSATVNINTNLLFSLVVFLLTGVALTH